MSRLSPLLAALLLTALATPALAQTPPGEIKGSDVMGDKSRSAVGGWSQAPVPREQSAAKDAPNPGGDAANLDEHRPVPPAESSNSSATEPQAPLEHRTSGPSKINPAEPTK